MTLPPPEKGKTAAQEYNAAVTCFMNQTGENLGQMSPHRSMFHTLYLALLPEEVQVDLKKDFIYPHKTKQIVTEWWFRHIRDI